MSEDFSFSESGKYKLPKGFDIKSIHEHIELLPNTEEPEVFGMHTNANISFQ